MDNDIKRLFRNLKEVTPSNNLKTRILYRIHESESRALTMQKTFSYIGTLISLLIALPIAQFGFSELYQSGIYTYLNLIISDPDVILSNISSIAMLFIDSFPTIGVIATLIAAFLIISSIRIKNNQSLIYKLT